MKGIDLMMKKIGMLFILTLCGVLAAPLAHAAKILILQTSLNKESKSDLLANALFKKAKELQLDVEQLSLKNYPLPLCDGHEGASYDNPQVKVIHDKIKNASVIIIAAPVYNFAVSAGTKNLYELTSHPHKSVLSGDAWRGKIVGFAGASGSPKSLMAPLSFINSLMLDAKCLIIPEIVMASGDDFKGQDPSQEISDRLSSLLTQAVRLEKSFELKEEAKK